MIKFIKRMETGMIKFINRYLYRFGFRIEPLNKPYLDDVVVSGGLECDLTFALEQYFGASQSTYMSDITRSKIRLELAKVVEKYIISGRQNDSMYKIKFNSINNQPSSIADNQLIVEVDTGDKHFVFTLGPTYDRS